MDTEKDSIFGGVGLMGKKYVDPKKERSRTYKLLLFCDNKQHMAALKRIQRDEEFKNSYVGIWHVKIDEEGQVITDGSGKKHCHVLLDLKNAFFWSSLCKKLGFVDEKGEIDCRFCMPISCEIEKNTGKFIKTGRSNLERGYQYLVHINASDKEQYPLSALWGAEEKLQNAYTAIQNYLAKNISMSSCVFMALTWIEQQSGIISYKDLTTWLCNSPYFKCQSSPLVRAVLDEHNRKFYMKSKREKDDIRKDKIKVSGLEGSFVDLSDFYSFDEMFEV